MPKKKKASQKNVRRRQPRSRTRTLTTLLDLGDELLLKILHDLGFVSDLHTHTLRQVAGAFSLARTCRRLLNIFCDAITSIDAQLTSYTSPPAFHPTHQEPHLCWLLRHAHELKSLKLPLDTSHALLALPCDSSLEELTLSSDYSGAAPSRLPRTLTKLDVDNPSPAFTSLLERLHNTATSCALTELRISSLHPDRVPDILTFFQHSAETLNLLYLSFLLSRDEDDARERDNDAATTAVRTICELYASVAPNISTLHFAVTCDSRLDTDLHALDVHELQPVIDELRTSPNNRPSSLRFLGFHTDVDLVSDWFHAISPAITPTTCVLAESALNGALFLPPLGGNLPAPVVVSVRMSTDIRGQRPSIDQLCASLLPVHSIYLTDRAVIDICRNSDEHRRATIAYATAVNSLDSIYAAVPFGMRSRRIAVWEGDQITPANLLSILGSDTSETPEYAAYSFFCDLFQATRGTKTVKLSFDCISYAHENESMTERMLSHLPNVEELRLVMPVEGQGSSRMGLVDATPGFLVGLPVFLRLLADACPELKGLHLHDVGDMAWDNEDEEEMLLSDAEGAVDILQRLRPGVRVDSIRAMLQYWKRGKAVPQ